MILRIPHIADNHIGISFNQYPEAARERLIEKRFASLERMVTTANDRAAHCIVVSGDRARELEEHAGAKVPTIAS